MKWKASTSGETLFLFIRESLLPELPESPAAWSHLGQVVNDVAGSRYFSDFIQGAIASQALRRLLMFCNDELPHAGPSTHQRLVYSFANEEMFPGLGRDDLNRLARLVLDAYQNSAVPISRATRNRILKPLSSIRCYLCTLELDLEVPDGHERFFGLDHIWPSSLGGESIDENLLPACRQCQIKKGDGPSWEWVSVHNLSWSAAPSDESINRIERHTRIARHLHHATTRAESQRCSIKQALCELGPMVFPARFDPTGRPSGFFQLQTIDEDS